MNTPTPMKTPAARYAHDAAYRQMVDLMEAMIQQCQFTPAEMRHVYRAYAVPVELAEALGVMQRWREDSSGEAKGPGGAP
jgi:hypothetical protein